MPSLVACRRRAGCRRPGCDPRRSTRRSMRSISVADHRHLVGGGDARRRGGSRARSQELALLGGDGRAQGEPGRERKVWGHAPAQGYHRGTLLARRCASTPRMAPWSRRGVPRYGPRMALPPTGRPAGDVLARLDAFQARDVDWKSGPRLQPRLPRRARRARARHRGLRPLPVHQRAQHRRPSPACAACRATSWR